MVKVLLREQYLEYFPDISFRRGVQPSCPALRSLCGFGGAPQGPALIKWFTWPAPACSHGNPTVGTTGLSQITPDLEGSTNRRAQQNSVDVSRDQHCKCCVQLLSLAMALGIHHPRLSKGGREGETTEAGGAVPSASRASPPQGSWTFDS